MEWSENNCYLRGIINKLSELPDPIRIAGFDLDDTLIHMPRGKNKYTEWKLIDTSIIQKIHDLVQNKRPIIIFTNQCGMSLNKNFSKKQWKNTIDIIFGKLFKNIPTKKYYGAIYVAKNYDSYRKPNLGLWKQMKTDLKETFGIDKLRISKNSFFVGDAAGRTIASPMTQSLHPNAKADHSDTDRKFALNIGIKFLTPEEFYTGKPSTIPYELKGFDPKIFLDKIPKTKSYIFVPRSKELVILVGPPGAGKTEFAKKYITDHAYVHINQDTCKTKKKCLEMVTQAMTQAQSIVIDNTNPDTQSRLTYTSLAKKYHYKHIRSIIINTDVELAFHLNNTRHVYSGGLVPKISHIVYHMYKNKYSKPTDEEHFDRIEKVNFSFDMEKLSDPVWKRIFMQWS